MSASSITADELGLKLDQGQPLRVMVEAGEFLYYSARFEESDWIFEALALIASDDPIGKLGLARNALATHRHKEALEFASQAIRCRHAERHDLARAQLCIGDAHIGLQKFREAELAWEKAMEFGGGFDGFAAEIGWRVKKLQEFQKRMQRECVTYR